MVSCNLNIIFIILLSLGCIVLSNMCLYVSLYAKPIIYKKKKKKIYIHIKLVFITVMLACKHYTVACRLSMHVSAGMQAE